MLSFAVYDQQGAPPGWSLSQAYLFGNDEIAVQGEIRVLTSTGRAGGSVIQCEKPSTDAAGLALQFRVGPPESPMGLLLLRTCLLPQRPEPYLLSLELARHRIMLVLNKLEEWGFFDLPADHPVPSLLDKARAEFTAALVHLCHRTGGNGAAPVPDPESILAADAAAGRALALSMEASERLALLQAEQNLQGRLDGSLYEKAQARADAVTGERPLPDNAVKSPDGGGVILPQPPMMGSAVAPAMFSDALVKGAADACDFVAMPMRWIDMEPSEGSYSFAKTDKWIEWAVRQAKLPVVGGPLIDFREISTPEWLYIWEHDYETLRELVYEHIKTVVTRYRRTVSRWTVCSGLHINESFALTYEKMMDLTRVCALLVKKLHPAAKVQIEIAQPWGEYVGRNRRAMPPRLYADQITLAGIVVDAFALRIQMGQPEYGRATRDLMAMSDLLDRYSELEKPLVVSAVGVPSQVLVAAAAMGPGPAGAPETGGEPPAALEAGFWRSPWSQEVQARWVSQALWVAAAKPYVHSICWQDLYDSPTADMPAGGLMSESGSAKPAAGAFGDLRAAIKGRRMPLASAT